MAWFKVDDGLHSSRKFLSIPKRSRFAAVGLWTVAGSWCADELTDGLVPDYMLEAWGAPPSAPKSLVDAGLWERESGGYLFCNWLEYQPRKADVDAEREASRERMRELRARRKQKKPQDDAAKGEVFERTGTNGSENVRNPDPTRPDPTPIEVTNVTSLSDSDESNADGELLTDAWLPSRKHFDHAVSLGLDPEAQLKTFRAHAARNQRRQKNWGTAFTNWLKKGAELAQQRQASGQQGFQRPQKQSAVDKARQFAADMGSFGGKEIES